VFGLRQLEGVCCATFTAISSDHDNRPSGGHSFSSLQPTLGSVTQIVEKVGSSHDAKGVFMSYTPAVLRYGSYKIGPYRYGEKKWDDYLLDIQYAVQEGSEDIAREAREQTSQLGSIASSIEDLRSDLNMGFSLMVGRLEEQITLTQAVIEELQGIHKTLKSPLITQADELIRLGHDNLRRGLFGKALECFLRSEQLYDVNPILQFHIGMVYLEGRDDTENLVNLPEAERHLLVAAKYAKAQEAEFKGSRIVWDDAYLHAAEANYLMSSEAARLRRSSEAAAYLQRAAQLAQQGARGRDRFYLAAKCHCLLGNGAAAKDIIRKLADAFHWYYSKAAADPDFMAIRDELVALQETLLSEPGPLTQQAKESLARATTCVENARDVDSRFSHRYHAQEIAALETSLRAQEGLLHSRKASMGEVAEGCNDIRQNGAKLTRTIIDEQIGILEGRLAPFISEVHQEKTKLDEVRRGASFGVFMGSVIVWTLILTPVACLVVSFPQRLEYVVHHGIPAGFLYALGISIIISLVAVWPGRQIRQQSKVRAASQRTHEPINRLNGEISKLRELRATLLS
jgi:hypothetical protein